MVGDCNEATRDTGLRGCGRSISHSRLLAMVVLVVSAAVVARRWRTYRCDERGAFFVLLLSAISVSDITWSSHDRRFRRPSANYDIRCRLFARGRLPGQLVPATAASCSVWRTACWSVLLRFACSSVWVGCNQKHVASRVSVNRRW